MNRLVIIGNGFDMAHGLKTSYMDFINWYWNQRVKSPELFSVEYSRFFKTILQSIETKGWVDIENDYYQLLKNGMDNPSCDYTIGELNEQLAFLQEKLIEYLHTIKTDSVRVDLQDAIIDFFDPADFSTEGKKKALDNVGLEISSLVDVRYNHEDRNKLIPERIMLLSFNYTETAKMYGNFNLTHNYIHGKLKQPENIIFGYGDELDKSYQYILDINDNELLRNIKSVKYLETRHYHDLLEFLLVAPF